MKHRVTHLIAGLGKGGAETMLYQLLLHRTDHTIEHKVVSLGAGSYYEEKIRKLGIEVEVLRCKKRPITSFFALCKRLKGQQALCCWMYHANFIGYVCGKISRVPRIIWNIRHSDLSKTFNKRSTLRIVKWCAKRSKNVAFVAYNGIKAKEVHEGVGYCKSKSVVLENGVDTNVFYPIDKARDIITAECQIPADKRIVLSVARYHPIKDVPSFVKAFSAVHAKQPDTVAVMCGHGIDTGNQELIKLCADNDLSVGKEVYLLGLRHDLPTLFSACDLYVLHSAGEAFPNTLVQAMACECLCVATDVGDAAMILDDAFCVVPPCSVQALSEKTAELLRLDIGERTRLCQRNRERIQTNYTVENVVSAYEQLFVAE